MSTTKGNRRTQLLGREIDEAQAPILDSSKEMVIETPDQLVARVSMLDAAAARDALCNELAERALQLCDAYRVAVTLYFPQHQSLFGTAQKGPWQDDFQAQELNTARIDSACVHAFHTGETYRVPDVLAEGVRYIPVSPDGVHPDPTCSTVAIPMQVGSSKLGALALDWKQPHGFHDKPLGELERLVQTYAQAIHRFHAVSQLDEIENLLQRIERVEYGSPRPFDPHQFLAMTASLVGAQQGSLFLRNPQTGRFELAAHLLRPDLVGAPDQWYELGEGLTGWIAQHNQLLRLPSLEAEELHRRGLAGTMRRKIHDNPNRDNNSQAPYLGVPVAAGREVLGVLRLRRNEARSFSSLDEQNARIVAEKLGSRLRQRLAAQRSHSLLTLAARFPTLTSLKDLTQQVFAAIERVLGPCDILLRLLDKMQDRHGQVQEVLRLVDANSSVLRDITPPMLGQEDPAAASWAWRSAGHVYAPNLQDESCSQARRFFAPVRQLEGCAVCLPMMIEGRVQGTLTVRKAYRSAFSEADLDFLQQVANVAIDWLEHLQEQRAREIALELEEAVYQFPEDLLAGKDLAAIERDFYFKALFKLAVGIGTTPGHGFVGIPNPTDGQLEVFDINEQKKSNFPPGVLDDIKTMLQKNDFLIIAQPAKELALGNTIEAVFGDSCSFLNLNRECWILAIKSEGQVLAVFFLFATSEGTMSYIRAERVRDILRRVCSAIELARSHERKRQWLAMLSPLGLIGAMTSSMEHQLRGPARRMIVNIDTLQDARCTKEDTRAILNNLKKDVETLNQATQKLIAFARESSVELGEVCLSDVLERAWQDLLDNRRHAQCENMPLFDLPAKSSVYVKGLREPLVLAFKFVLQNALQAVERKQTRSEKHEGRIAIQIEEEPKRVAVRITDNGDGMDESMRKQALSPFVSGHSRGTGLGLTAVASILHSQEGDMRIDSRLGEGTTVTLFLTKKEEL
jgi:signal transduction histidine kinase/transcriptional regulator with GAF, ATPase, and Fis domain